MLMPYSNSFFFGEGKNYIQRRILILQDFKIYFYLNIKVHSQNKISDITKKKMKN